MVKRLLTVDTNTFRKPKMSLTNILATALVKQISHIQGWIYIICYIFQLSCYIQKTVEGWEKNKESEVAHSLFKHFPQFKLELKKSDWEN